MSRLRMVGSRLLGFFGNDRSRGRASFQRGNVGLLPPGAARHAARSHRSATLRIVFRLGCDFWFPASALVLKSRPNEPSLLHAFRARRA